MRAVLLLVAVLLGAPPASVPLAPAAQATATIALTPSCAQPGQPFTVQVSGFGWYPGDKVTVRFAAAESSEAPVDPNGVFVVTLAVAGRPRGTYVVEASGVLQNPGLRGRQVDRATADFVVPCFEEPPPPPPLVPALTIAPACGPGDGTGVVGVDGTDFPAGVIVDITFGGVFLRGVRTSSSGAFATTITPPPAAPAVYEILAAGGDPRFAAGQLFLVPCGDTPPPPPTVAPRLECVPPIGQPGSVTMAVGTDFPSGTTVTLRWSLGFRNAVTATVGPDGTFRAPMLVMIRDALGPRALEAEYGAAAPATAAYLVVPGTAAPGGDDREVVFR